MPNPQRILVIDSQPVCRTGLKTVIEAGGKYSVINEAGTGRQGLRLAEQLQPDIVIAGAELSDTDGVRLTREIRKRLKNTRVMVLSARAEISDLIRALQAGASGYMLKDADPEGILKCLETLARGKEFIDRSFSEEWCLLARTPGILESTETDISERYGKLSDREREVKELILRGSSPKEIGARLGISPHTVRAHRANIMRKSGAKNTAELMYHTAGTEKAAGGFR